MSSDVIKSGRMMRRVFMQLFENMNTKPLNTCSSPETVQDDDQTVFVKGKKMEQVSPPPPPPLLFQHAIKISKEIYLGNIFNRVNIYLSLLTEKDLFAFEKKKLHLFKILHLYRFDKTLNECHCMYTNICM